MKGRTLIIILVILLVFAGLLIPGFSTALNPVAYTVTDSRISAPVRIVLVTDLHSCAYGDGQKELLEAIDARQPNLVLLGGDIFDVSLPDDRAAAFLRAVGSRYPCYFVTGNHEYRCSGEVFARRMALLEECGITRLSGEAVPITVGRSRFMLCGVDDPYAWGHEGAYTEHNEGSYEAQTAQLGAAAGDGTYTVLLAHRPEYMDLYRQAGFDLVLAGHAHGGQWRIPGLINGVYAPDQGLFPAYAGGLYERFSTTMIVSRGLATGEITSVPRIYNRPELITIDLQPEEAE